MMRVIRVLLGLSRREREARAEMEEYRAQHAAAMQALDHGARRIQSESRRTQEAAAALMAHLREDLV